MHTDTYLARMHRSTVTHTHTSTTSANMHKASTALGAGPRETGRALGQVQCAPKEAWLPHPVSSYHASRIPLQWVSRYTDAGTGGKADERSLTGALSLRHQNTRIAHGVHGTIGGKVPPRQGTQHTGSQIPCTHAYSNEGEPGLQMGPHLVIVRS